MADRETEAEWEKSRRIEAERMKAARAMREEQPDKLGLAYLAGESPRLAKVKGYSRNIDAIMASCERMGNASGLLAIGGVVLGLLTSVASMVSVTAKLGLAGGALTMILGTLEGLCIGGAVITAVIALVAAAVYKVKYGRKLGAAVWSAVGGIVIVVVYVVVRMLLLQVA